MDEASDGMRAPETALQIEPKPPRGTRASLATCRAVAAWAVWPVRPRWKGFGEPFNGQRRRLEVVERFAAAYRPDAWVETGTLAGHTTRWLAERGRPVYTVESDPGFYRLAKWRLRRYANCRVSYGDSVEFLRRLGDRASLRNPFLYLDAHANDRSRIAEEIAVALGAWDEVAVLVDDVAVPGDPRYKCNTVEGSPLSASLLDLPADLVVAYPAVPAERETGAHRGAIWLSRGAGARAAGEMIEQGLLRAA